MSSLTSRLTKLVSAAFPDDSTEFGVVKFSNRPDLGQFQCNGALAAAKKHGKNPREIAQSVVDKLYNPDIFQRLEIAGPGFINITVTDDYLLSYIKTLIEIPHFGIECDNPKMIVLDYGGPNIAKPMHVGHLRSAIIGESLKRIAKFIGHRVLADVHLGDWGLPMGMIICEISKRQPNLSYFDATHKGTYPKQSPVSIIDLENIYPAAKKNADADPDFLAAAREATKLLQQGEPGYRALWEHFVDVSITALKKDYAQLDVDFDLWLGESHVQSKIHEMVTRLQQQGFAKDSEGAVIIQVRNPEDDKPLPPLILLKSDGAVLYSTTDLATIAQRVKDYSPAAILYVVDQRQSDHFQQVFRSAYKTQIAPAELGLEHIGFGTINGKDGKPFKTREGGVMKLKDLLSMVTDTAKEKLEQLKSAQDYSQQEKLEIAEKVGIAALKFADLVNHRSKNYIFDLDRFVSFEGKTGPYLQYTIVRGNSILQKAKDKNIKVGALSVPDSEAERNLFLKLAQFTEAVEMAFSNRAPNHICEFAFQLANEYNRFLHQIHILNETNVSKRASLLALTRLCVEVLNQTMQLLAIPVPARM